MRLPECFHQSWLVVSTIAGVSSRMTSPRDRVRISSLTVGLAATVGAWTFVAAFAPATLEALGGYSPWIYGPASTAVWALFSGATYALLCRNRDQNAGSDALANYRCPELGIAAPAAGTSVCASREEKTRLGAATAGFALTISTWVAALSFMPEDLLDSLSAAPVWFYCLVSIGLWAAFSTLMYMALSHSDRPPLPPKRDLG